jgi:tRNA(Ile)-lysidine synthase
VRPVLEKVKKTIEKYSLFTPRSRIIVGFSGGVDSVCLLHVLRNLPGFDLDLWALYVNHQLRPGENRREIDLLHSLGIEWGVKTRQIEINIPEKLRMKRQSLQLLAREERYRAFETVGREIDARRIALAHHRDDQAETVLYRIIRGTALDGLAGMAASRDDFYIRPLLAVTRGEILQYATEHQLTWVEDSSNQKLIYCRNRLRRQLLPEIESAYNPRFKDGLIRLAGLAGEHREFMEKVVADAGREIIRSESGRIGLKLEPFLQSHPYLQYYLMKKVIDRVLPGRSIETGRLLKFREKINGEKNQFRRMRLTKEVEVSLIAGTVFFGPPEASNGWRTSCFPVAAPGVTEFAGRGSSLAVSPAAAPLNWDRVTKWEIFIDAATVKLPLQVRFWRAGDRFWPLGVAGRQKLSDFFINRKVPRKGRTKVPLLVDGADRIVWVIGYRLSAEFKVTPATREIWRVAVNLEKQGSKG